MHDLSVAELSAGLSRRDFSSVELTTHFIERIQQFDKQINAYITPFNESALKAAQQADALIASGDQGDLTGIPYGHKDIFCTKGQRTTCGSKMLENFIAPYDATVSEKLNQSGAVCLGKTNMDEFAMGSSNETSYFGRVHNPWALNSVPGGSSGGSAAAVAARLAPVATATDTGGSIRQPASLCGLTGIKPTYGLVSRWGMIAFASSLDQGGTLGRSAEDCAILLQAMVGHDAKDSTSVQSEIPNYREQLGLSLDGLKIGIPKEYFSQGLNPQVQQRVEDALKEYEKMGAVLIDISLPNAELAVPTYYVLAPAEASANLSRFDGVRYGYRCSDPKDLLDLYTRTRAEGFGDEVKRRLLVGTYVLSEGYYDAYFRKAQQVRRLMSQDFKAAFEQVDIIAGPTCPSTAFSFGSKSDNPVEMYLEDIYTISVNLAGLPGLSHPCGLVDGLPVGLQLIGNHFQESTILAAAHQYQQATDWHTKMPSELSGIENEGVAN